MAKTKQNSFFLKKITQTWLLISDDLFGWTFFLKIPVIGVQLQKICYEKVVPRVCRTPFIFFPLMLQKRSFSSSLCNTLLRNHAKNNSDRRKKNLFFNIAKQIGRIDLFIKNSWRKWIYKHIYKQYRQVAIVDRSTFRTKAILVWLIHVYTPRLMVDLFFLYI